MEEYLNHANSVAKEMLEFASQTWGIDITGLRVVVDESEERTRSWGGSTRISIALQRCIREPYFREYQAFSADPVIGNFHGDTMGRIAATVAHEVAHAVVLKLHPMAEPHGDAFKLVYRTFRVRFVNHHTTEAAPQAALVKHEIVLHQKFGRCKVIGYNPRAHKYPYVIEDASGRLWKVTESSFRRAQEKVDNANDMLRKLGLLKK